MIRKPPPTERLKPKERPLPTRRCEGLTKLCTARRDKSRATSQHVFALEICRDPRTGRGSRVDSWRRGGKRQKFGSRRSSQHQTLELSRIPRKWRWQSPRRRSCLRLHRHRRPAARAMFKEKESEKATHKHARSVHFWNGGGCCIVEDSCCSTRVPSQLLDRSCRHSYTPYIRIDPMRQHKTYTRLVCNSSPAKYQKWDFQAQPRTSYLLGVLG